jgi:hypothetical protein
MSAKKLLAILVAFGLYVLLLIAGAQYGVTSDWYLYPTAIAGGTLVGLFKLKEGN